MEQHKFETVIREQLEKSSALLFSKNAAYNPNTDKLRGFKTAAALEHKSTRAALAGMMAKHTVSVYDMCLGDLDFDMDVWDEKITDHINYLLLLRAVVEEESPKMESEVPTLYDVASLYPTEYVPELLEPLTSSQE